MDKIKVAIIGAGISGLSLAIALHRKSIQCVVYEAHHAPLDTGGGVTLTPNGLKVLQSLGIYDSLLTQGFPFDESYMQLGPTGQVLGTIQWGSTEKYGMSALRVYRSFLHECLLSKVRELGIAIHFGHKFSHVVSETDKDVAWKFMNSEVGSASILVGADGIHSKVRSYVAPDSECTYGSIVSLVAAVPTAQLEIPKEEAENVKAQTNKHPLPISIIVPQLGAFVIVPQTKNGDEVMITVLRRLPDEPERWGPINDDKERLRAMFRENLDRFPQIVQNALRSIPEKRCHIWPAYSISRLGNWTSAKATEDGGGHSGRVVVLGDAAHALPPSAGQGANQALEDVYTFAGALSELSDNSDIKALRTALSDWQIRRQQRLDIVTRLVKKMQVIGLPAQETQHARIDKESIEGSLKDDYDSLFKADFI